VERVLGPPRCERPPARRDRRARCTASSSDPRGRGAGRTPRRRASLHTSISGATTRSLIASPIHHVSTASARRTTAARRSRRGRARRSIALTSVLAERGAHEEREHVAQAVQRRARRRAGERPCGEHGLERVARGDAGRACRQRLVASALAAKRAERDPGHTPRPSSSSATSATPVAARRASPAAPETRAGARPRRARSTRRRSRRSAARRHAHRPTPFWSPFIAVGPYRALRFCRQARVVTNLTPAPRARAIARPREQPARAWLLLR
jgi:hypothetical protein